MECFASFVLNEAEVLNGMINLKISYSAGSNCIPEYILKYCTIKLYKLLTFIFNGSLKEGQSSAICENISYLFVKYSPNTLEITIDV